jgi:hypothetical protein
MGCSVLSFFDRNTPAPEAEGGFVLRQDQVLDGKNVGPELTDTLVEADD